MTGIRVVAGGRWQAEGSNHFVFGSDPKTVEAFQYVVDLINKYHVAPGRRHQRQRRFQP